MRNFIRFFRILLPGIIIFYINPQAFSQDLEALSRSGMVKTKSPVTDNQPGDARSLAVLLEELETEYQIHFSYASHLVNDRFVNPTEKLKEAASLDELLNHILSP